MEFFQIEKVTPSTTKITDVTGVAMYLVEGREKAVLIDTATGTGDLKAFVDTLTDKPLEVILTHGHCDHAGGAAPFEKVWLHKNDWALVKHHAGMPMKTEYVQFSVPPEVWAQIKPEDFAPEREAGYLPLEDGQLFDLGGVTLEIVHVPGHTQGMCCVLNREERSILFGDACNPSVFLWDEESSCVEDYRNSLLELKKQEDRWDTVYLSHASTTVDRSVLDGVIQVCQEIMADQNDWQPFEFLGHHLKLAKKTDPAMQRLDGGLGNIVYNPEKIFAGK